MAVMGSLTDNPFSLSKKEMNENSYLIGKGGMRRRKNNV